MKISEQRAPLRAMMTEPSWKIKIKMRTGYIYKNKGSQYKAHILTTQRSWVSHWGRKRTKWRKSLLIEHREASKQAIHIAFQQRVVVKTYNYNSLYKGVCCSWCTLESIKPERGVHTGKVADFADNHHYKHIIQRCIWLRSGRKHTGHSCPP